jgi:acetylglutamate kinase
VTTPEIPSQIRERTVAKARTLLDALPFMQEHRGTTVVVKVGGAVMERSPLARSFAEDVSLLQQAGIHTVIVHGGGPQVTEVSTRLGLETTFVDGVRVTDRETLDVATMVLAGTLNTRIVASLTAGDVPAVGLSGVDGRLAVARRQTEPDLGYVGEIVRVNAAVLRTLLSDGFVPVVASIAADAEGQPFNVNADAMAADLAIGLEAAKLVSLSDVPGVIGPEGDLLTELGVEEALELLDRPDVVDGGMIPKLESSVRALKAGVTRVHLLDGRVEHALVLELFTPEGIGTMVTLDPPSVAPGPASEEGP